MITVLEYLGPAIWRASWQAAALAILVVLLLRCFGERLAPRWRFLLLGVVLTRLLVVATPASPLSVFNLVPGNRQASARPVFDRAIDPSFTLVSPGADATAGPSQRNVDSPRFADSEPKASVTPVTAPLETPSVSADTTPGSTLSLKDQFDAILIAQILSAIWLAGCLFMGLKLLATAIVLRRRLSACRPVTDAAILELLETCFRRTGLRRTPALLVTPEQLSPCIVGTWNPAIVLPESVVTEFSAERLCHVLAHELAHLVRGDSWTNWLLLAARILHWFNPVAWWTVREMQAEREAACDELAFAALGEAHRSAYQKVKVSIADEPLPPAPEALGKSARVSGELGNAVLSPASEQGRYVWHFYDLDTGYRPRWPIEIPRDENTRDANQLADWASRSGADLMCIAHRSADGTETYVLKALGMKVREINSRELRNLEHLVTAGTLPDGRPVGELLMHFDSQSQQLVPNANGAFLYVTREGNMGLIETTDRVTSTANLAGGAGGPPAGVGFYKGVRFNLKAIIP